MWGQWEELSSPLQEGMLKNKLGCTHKQWEFVHAVSLQGGARHCLRAFLQLQTCFHHCDMSETGSSKPSTPPLEQVIIFITSICAHTDPPQFLLLLFCSARCLCQITWKKIPQLHVHFSSNKSKPVFNPWLTLTHISHGVVLAWGELLASWSSARGKPYTQALGDHSMYWCLESSR